ncbi:MAG: DNA translocase FtsK [Bacteroidaceae bacterium]|nr:DNA translocase FtsK [Bacteroidaceae bacterium]
MEVTFTTPTGTTYSLFNDMLKQSHLLIAGASGSGKSVLVNGLICTALYSHPFDKAGGKQLILIDPKRTELSPYKRVPHCLRYASEPNTMVDALHYALGIVEQRYRVMEAQGLRKYNGSDVYVIIEELADLMTTQKRTVQPLIQRLCQIARAARVHLWAITQCPLATIITTPIKVNFDGIVALRTRCAQDSRNIIGVKGAEVLPRYGDCLYLTPDKTEVERWKVPYITEAEQSEMIRWWVAQLPTRQPLPTPPFPTPPRRGFFKRLFGR